MNVYQHTADKRPQQLQCRLLEGLSALFHSLRQHATAILVMGDFNAAWGGHWNGYTTDFLRTNDLFTLWVSAEDLQPPSCSYDYTWYNHSGPQRAMLDYMMAGARN